MMSTPKTGADEPRVMREIAEVFDDLETLLKNDEAGSELADRGVNIALALMAVSGLKAYLAGNKVLAIEDLSTAVEEIAARAGTPELRGFPGALDQRVEASG